MRPGPLDDTHVQALLVQLLEYGYGELHVRIHDHAIASIVPMPTVKHAPQVEGIQLALTVLETRTSITR